MANLRSKNDRAIAAYLASVVAGVDSTVQIYPANYSGERVLPLVDVLTAQGPETPPFSGNHLLSVRVRVEYPAANQPGETNASANRLALDAMADAVFDAFHLSDNGCDYSAVTDAITAAGNALATSDPTNNADMDDYTCLQFLGVEYYGGPDDAASMNFVELIKFQVLAAPLGGLS